MNKLLAYYITILSFICANSFAQSDSPHDMSVDPLSVEEYKLKNGLTVYLNEDHNQPMVYGAVVVKGGSKRDPKDATGIAHYLEHMMFRGTDKIGTTDFEAEKIFLDSITLLYDSLAKESDQHKRSQIQIHINNLSIQASEYVIPDDLGNMLEEIGSSDINAYTSEDCIVYYNLFPGFQINKWIEVYSHRFINPVFRSFQPELEVVYEEKNMYSDDMYTILYESFYNKFFKKHPYGQETILGRIEHLKNPSLSEMYDYFNTYYVANNMALVISGDFNISDIKPLIEEKFGKWRSGEIPEMPDYSETDFNSREYIKEKILPMRIGMIGFRGVSMCHDDFKTLEICDGILTNDALTGFLDQLYLDNKLLEVDASQEIFVDEGGNVIYFIPKSAGQSVKKGEKLILNEIERLKNGEFSDTLLESVKTSLIKEHLDYLEVVNEYDYDYEDYFGRRDLIIDAFLCDKKWSDIKSYDKQIMSITRDDVIAAAKKYFGPNYLMFHLKSGKDKPAKLNKPPYKPVISSPKQTKSEFDKQLDKIETLTTVPDFVDLNKDVLHSDIAEKVHFFYTENPFNDLFSLNIKFGVGTYEYPILNQVAKYLNIAGTDQFSHYELASRLQELGSNVEFYCSGNSFCIIVDGFEKNLNQTLKTISLLLSSVEQNHDLIKTISRDFENDISYEFVSPEVVGDALLEFSIYEEESSYINRLSASEIKKLTVDSLFCILNIALEYEASIHYAGRLPPDTVKKEILTNIHFVDDPVKSISPQELVRKDFDENTVYFINSKNAVQSQVYLYVEGEINNEKDRAIADAFNLYLDDLIYNEIRDFRSLAYSAEGYYTYSFYKDKPGYTLAYLSTQADKTIDALEVLVSIFDKLPETPEQIENIRSTLTRSVNSEKPSFRTLSYWVESVLKQGYNEDPRINKIKEYKDLEFEDLSSFYRKNIQGKPYVFVIVGNKDLIGIDELNEYGNIFEYNKAVVFTY